MLLSADQKMVYYAIIVNVNTDPFVFMSLDTDTGAEVGTRYFYKSMILANLLFDDPGL